MHLKPIWFCCLQCDGGDSKEKSFSLFIREDGCAFYFYLLLVMHMQFLTSSFFVLMSIIYLLLLCFLSQKDCLVVLLQSKMWLEGLCEGICDNRYTNSWCYSYFILLISGDRSLITICEWSPYICRCLRVERNILFCTALVLKLQVVPWYVRSIEQSQRRIFTWSLCVQRYSSWL